MQKTGTKKEDGLDARPESLTEVVRLFFIPLP
jgi:hypothetical protein